MEVILNKAGAHKSVKDVDFSPDGKYLVSLGNSGPAKVWDVTSKIAVASLSKEYDEVFCYCRFSESNDMNQVLYIAAVTGKGGSIVTWDTKTWKRMGSKTVVRDTISAFSVSPDGKLLACGTTQGDIFILNSSSKQVQTIVRKAHVGFVTALSFAHDSRALASISLDSSARVTLFEEEDKTVVRTFQQRWRSANGYKIRNLGDHRVLFVFDNSSDVETIIKNQPWSFDKHLVVLQTFEKFSKLKDLVFDKTLFWVQVLDIAESIWETIGAVRRSPESTNDDGGNFIRELFTVDITLPLCRGRVFKLENGEKSWVCFQYERAAPYQTSGRREILVPGYYGQVATTKKVSSEEGSPLVATAVGKSDTVTEDDKERINAVINSKGLVTVETSTKQAMKEIYSHNIKISDFSLPDKTELILIENEALSTLTESNEGINSSLILAPDLEKMAEPNNMVETARSLGKETPCYHKSSLWDSTLTKISGLSFKVNKFPSNPVGSVTGLRGDNKGRRYGSVTNYVTNYPTYFDHIQGVKGFMGDQVHGPTCLLSEDVKVFPNNFVKLLYSHVMRNDNMVAHHSLARNALCIPDVQVWMEDVPSHIFSILLLDVVELH
ncbi:hypothetical protein SO802_019810 [Lithocarpus litseifolius]|uniref:DUF4283 domain-containing protein n=1 Tax=Lithocarpus litseifolius TaxID=425828 RepID=A0AAW2CRR3_9ROSI